MIYINSNKKIYFPLGSEADICEPSGKCICKTNIENERCEHCLPGYYDYPYCKSKHTICRYGAHIIFCNYLIT